MTFSTRELVAKRLSLMITVAIGITGCAPSQQELIAKDRLQQARATYRQAEADPNVQTYAQVPLNDAAKTLQEAEKTDEFFDMETRAYVAERKARTALAIAEAKQAENQVQLLRKENTEALLNKREREAQMARGEAAEKTREVEQLKQETQSKTSEAEKVKAEARAREAEQAKAETRAEQAQALAETKSREAERAKAEAEESKAGNAQLVKELGDLEAKQTERGVVLTLGDVLFPFAKAELSPRARSNIEKLTDFLAKHPNRKVLIEGHTDNVGSTSFNMTLSEKRAQAVKKMLTDRGVEAGRITTEGYGKSRPVASNATPYGRQLNRRVEVVILNPSP